MGVTCASHESKPASNAATHEAHTCVLVHTRSQRELSSLAAASKRASSAPILLHAPLKGLSVWACCKALAQVLRPVPSHLKCKHSVLPACHMLQPRPPVRVGLAVNLLAAATQLRRLPTTTTGCVPSAHMPQTRRCSKAEPEQTEPEQTSNTSSARDCADTPVLGIVKGPASPINPHTAAR